MPTVTKSTKRTAKAIPALLLVFLPTPRKQRMVRLLDRGNKRFMALQASRDAVCPRFKNSCAAGAVVEVLVPQAAQL